MPIRRPSSPRPARTAAAVTAAAAALAVPAAPAHAAPELVLPSGLTEPAGLAQTPDGSLWVSDGAKGICRIDLEPEPRIVEDGVWCTAGETEDEVRSGPTGATQLAFDATTSSLYAGEGTSAAGGVWRLRWDPDTRTIADGAPVHATPDDRVFGLAVAPGGHVDFTTKRSPLVGRILDAAGTPSATVAGAAMGDGAASLAYAGSDLFLAEETGVTRIATPGAPGANAAPVLGFPGGVPSALAADPGRARVYAGTTNPNGRDTVDVLDVGSGAVETYASGLGGIGAMVVGSGGELYVADDPTSAAEAVDVVGQGRLWRIDPAATNRPRVTIDAAPTTFTNATTARFTFSSAPDVGFRCRFDGAPVQDCGQGPSAGSVHEDLAEGLHVFSVHAVDAAGRTGEPLRRTFVVDRRAPVVTVDNPAGDRTIESSALTLRFSADESGTEFTCSLDGAAPTPCDAPVRLTGLALGEHEVVVAGADRAGNASAPARFAFRVRAPEPRPVVDSAPAPTPAPAPAPGVTAPATTSAPAQGTVAVLGARCRRLSAPKVSWARWSRNRRSLVVRVRPLKDSVFLRLSLRGPRKAGSKKPGSPLVTAILPGHATQLTWRLRAEQVARLRSGRYALAVAAASCGRRFGTATVLRPRAAR
jgi:hypothetical protein